MPGFLAMSRDDLCLDFANTLSWRGSDPQSEELHAPGDLLAWATASGGADPALVERLGEHWKRKPEEAGRALALAILLREALWGMMSAIALGGTPEPADLAVLNGALATAPPRRELRPSGGTFGWALAAEAPAVPLLLAPVVWSAGDLLVSGRRARVRRCGNERCLWLFLDDSKSGNRRWCSMRSCGNRAKAHRHYLRQRGEREVG
jgi:predicted RNA-binding Zn ribbon-like protein